MNLFPRWRPWRSSVAPADRVQVARRLQEQLAALEAELARTSRALAESLLRQAEAERRAFAAVSAGDDRAARRALVEQKTENEQAALLEADRRVLQVLVDECRDALRQTADLSSSAPPP
jgi:hypothetical protein